MKPINYRRGGLRAWLALSLLWCITVAIVAFSVFDRDLPWNSPNLAYWTSSESDVPQVWDFPADWDINMIDRSVIAIMQEKPFYKNCVHVPDKDPKVVSFLPCETIEIPQEKDLRRQVPIAPRNKLLIALAVMVGPPIAVLAAFSLFCWVIAGFSSVRS